MTSNSRNLDAFQGARLRTAREARMMTASSLAEATGISAQSLSNYENDRQKPRHVVVGKLAEVLRVPRSHFYRPVLPREPFPFLMRSMAAATKRAQDGGKRKTDWLRELIRYVRETTPMPQVDVPALWTGDDPTVITSYDIEEMAIQLRAHWGMRDGPIENVTELLESKGVVVSCFSLNADKLDAFSRWLPEAPIVVENSDSRLNAVRMRFDICHELFHLVAHRNVPDSTAATPAIHKLMESQAHRFSGAFLFPESSFSAEIYSVAMEELLPAKRRWKMAGAAMISRAYQLEMITHDQYQRAFRRLSAQGYRRVEPLDTELEIEFPTALADRVREMVRNLGIKAEDLEAQVGLLSSEIETLAGLAPGWLSSPVDNVVPLHRK